MRAARGPTYQSSVSLCAGRLCWRLRLRFRAPPEPGSQPPASPPPSSVPSPAAPRARLLPPGVQLRRPLRLPPEARVCPPPLLRARPLRLGHRRLEHAHVDGRGRVGGREERVRRPLEVLERKASEKGPWCAISISRLHLGESSKSSWCASRLAALRSPAACTLPKLGRAAHSGSRASSSLAAVSHSDCASARLAESLPFIRVWGLIVHYGRRTRRRLAPGWFHCVWTVDPQSTRGCALPANSTAGTVLRRQTNRVATPRPLAFLCTPDPALD